METISPPIEPAAPARLAAIASGWHTLLVVALGALDAYRSAFFGARAIGNRLGAKHHVFALDSL